MLSEARILAVAAAAQLRLALASTAGSAASDYALILAALALAVIGWLGAAEALAEWIWPALACTMQDACMGR